MTVTSETGTRRASMEALRGRPYLVVAGDSHAGPILKTQLREYCPKQYLADFDAYVAEIEAAALSGHRAAVNEIHSLEALARTKACAGQNDPHARLRDMDADGVAVDVIFAGGQNDEVLPFLGGGFGAGSVECSLELRAVGCHIWNAWLADFCSTAPDRLIGAAQIPVWDVDASIKEIRWAREAGLTALNFPAPRRDFAPYNDPAYEPFWSAIEDLDIPLLTHSAGGEIPLGATGPGASGLLFQSEVHWFSRRSLWQMIFGFVFENHPSIKLVFTETRVVWVADYLNELDSIHEMQDFRGKRLPKYPSEYWKSNCFVVGSFMAPFEAARRDEVGIENLLWGSDYPHVEGTWPRTQLCLRNTFSDVPEDDTRMILGENAVPVYGLDAAKLREVADRIGPSPAQLAQALAPEEFPAHQSFAFRKRGNYS